MANNISKTPNNILMERALVSLKGKWGLSIKIYLIFYLFSLIGNIPGIGWIITIIVMPSLTVGLTSFYLSLSRNKVSKSFKENIKKITNPLLSGDNIGAYIAAYAIMIISILISGIFLIIPGIIVWYVLSQTYFIFADDKTISAMDALKKSFHMMEGNKWKLFCLHCRFIGWILLSVCTLGIGFLWLFPYVSVSTANFYDDLRGNNKIPNNYENDEDLGQLIN